MGEALKKHLAARQEWFAFHERIESQGKVGNLDREENEQLTVMVTRKKETGKALAAALQ